MTFLRLERCFLPPPEVVRWNGGKLLVQKCTTVEKIVHCVKNVFTFGVLFLASPFTLAYDWTFRAPVKGARRASDIFPSPVWPPEKRGFASSLFQTSGLGTKWSAPPNFRGRCDWNKWMEKEAHVAHPPGFDYRNFFTDVLSDPRAYIQMLRAHNVTAHRFSLEWSVIQPRPGETDSRALLCYVNFIRELQKAGITPSITLSHFVLPDWFHESGGFQRIENIERYVQFATQMIEYFYNVTDWWSFNELGVKAFQQAREVYPTDIPEGSSLPARVYAAGVATRNMLIAHCQLHEEVAKRYPGKRVGVTHQWLKFDTASGNWLERLFAYIFTKFGFTPVYQFFKNGRYSFEFPFMANIQFEIPEEEFKRNGGFLMSLGIQAYPQAMMKMGLNGGERYPGLPGAVQTFGPFTFGSTCEPGGTVMRFGPRWKAERMEEILDEAFDLTDQISITEFGSDARVYKWGREGFELDDEAQAAYLRLLTEAIRDYSIRTGRQIEGIYCWSDLRRQLEWENGHECCLATIDPVVDENRHMIDWRGTPASEYLREVYRGGAAAAAASHSA